MELTIDTKAKTIILANNISISELYKFLKTTFPKCYKDYKIIPNTSYMTYTDCFNCPYKPYRKIIWDGTTPLFDDKTNPCVSLYNSDDITDENHSNSQKYTVHFQKHNKI